MTDFIRRTQIIARVPNEPSRDDSQITSRTRDVVVASQDVALRDSAVPPNVAALYRDPDMPTTGPPGKAPPSSFGHPPGGPS
jgi:hypothetical protein